MFDKDAAALAAAAQPKLDVPKVSCRRHFRLGNSSHVAYRPSQIGHASPSFDVLALFSPHDHRYPRPSSLAASQHLARLPFFLCTRKTHKLLATGAAEGSGFPVAGMMMKAFKGFAGSKNAVSIVSRKLGRD